MHAMDLKRYVIPPRYQSQGIDLDHWFQLFTLCLAPLVLHVASGVPEPTILDGDDPGWWDRLPLFNPVSILWRYHAIADRRLRAKQWDKYDMAASNAAFWNGRTWDGSEAMLVRSRDWVTREPASSHVALLSASTLSTLALSLQGVQAIVSVTQLGPKSQGEALNLAFSHFAIFSFFRLFAACWLSNDYGFAIPKEERKASLLPGHPQWPQVASLRKLSRSGVLAAATIRRPESLADCPRLFRTDIRLGRLYRIFWMLTILLVFSGAAWGLGIHIIWLRGEAAVTTSAAVQRIFYNMIATGTLVTHGFYVLSGRNTSAIIPCAQQLWYKLYTCLVWVMIGLIIVLSALETHTCWNGGYPVYTTYPCDKFS